MNKRISIQRTRKRAKNDAGVALMLTLVFVVLLAAIITEFVYEMEVEASFVAGNDKEFQAYIAAKSAVAAGMAMLADDIYLQTENPDMPASPIIDGYDEEWAFGQEFTPLNAAMMRTRIDDEFGKLNLNALYSFARDPETGEMLGEPQWNEPLFDMLTILLDRRAGYFEDIDVADLIDSIREWIDIDDETDSNGEESEYYLENEVPYRAKDDYLTSLEELLLLPGMTPEFFYGDPEEDVPPLSSLLTCFGFYDPDPTDGLNYSINVNTAHAEILVAWDIALNGVNEADAEESVARFLEEREGGSFTEIGQVSEYFRAEDVRDVGNESRDRDDTSGRQVPDDRAQPLPNYLLGSDVFRIYGDGIADDVRVRIEAYVWRDNGESNDPPPQMFQIVSWRVIS